MSTALQNIEREKGAKQERKWLAAEVRRMLKMYKGDLALKERREFADIIIARWERFGGLE